MNRVDALRTLLDALRLQTHANFEVVVVNGPSTDATDELLREWDGRIKARSCPEPNLSMSRNIGLRDASSAIVAFIDDDAVPEATWLEELVAPFDEPSRAAVGGLVLDHHGTRLEYEGIVADRYGGVRKVSGPTSDLRVFPESWEFPYVPGGNAAYRKDVLTRIGMFDENIAYYLDETDVCARMIDGGWVVGTVRGAVIHHKSLPSTVRNERRTVLDWAPIVRSRTYFALKHAGSAVGHDAALAATAAWIDALASSIDDDRASGRLTESEHFQARASLQRGFELGRDAAVGGPRHAELECASSGFVAFPTYQYGPNRAVAVIVSRVVPEGEVEWPPTPFGVRLLVPSTDDVTTVDLSGAAWTHRVAADAEDPDPMMTELLRLIDFHRVDVVVGDAADESTRVRASAQNIPFAGLERLESLLATPVEMTDQLNAALTGSTSTEPSRDTRTST